MANTARIAQAIREILAAAGEDLGREALAQTPLKAAETWVEMTRGLREDAGSHLRNALLDGASAETGELVAVRDIRFVSLCEHHLLPFRGIASVVYAPGAQIVGLSAIPKALDVLAAKPQVQERLGQEMADLLVSEIGAAGALVQLVASHGCMTDRGAREKDARVVTVAASGSLRDDAGRLQALQVLAASDEVTL